MSNEIITKEIRGINLRLILSIVVTVATVTGAYLGIIDRLKSNDTKFEIIQNQIKDVLERIATIKEEQKDLQKQVDQNTHDIEFDNKKK